MEKKHRFFIYDRKEMSILILLGLMVALFAFTLGVHLGKKLSVGANADHWAAVSPVQTKGDQTPGRQELDEQKKGVGQEVDDSLNQALHAEVARVGIKLDQSRQIELPGKTKSKNQGKTQLKHLEKKKAPPTTQKKEELEKSPGVEVVDVSPSQPVEKKSPSAETSAAVPVQKKDVAVKTFQEPPASVAQDNPRGRPSGRFTIQVGSYPTLKEARGQVSQLQQLLKEEKDQAFFNEATIKGKGTWYRVYVGGFSSTQEAKAAAAKYRSAQVIRSFIVAKMP